MSDDDVLIPFHRRSHVHRAFAHGLFWTLVSPVFVALPGDLVSGLPKLAVLLPALGVAGSFIDLAMFEPSKTAQERHGHVARMLGGTEPWRFRMLGRDWTVWLRGGHS